MALRVGRYETIRALASGGMATVYLGRALGEAGVGRLIAVKVLHRHLSTDPEFVAMFFDEARLAARIRHPNVVATIDVKKSAEGVFLVMEYIEGPSVDTLLRAMRTRGNPPPVALSLRIFLDAL